MRRDIKAEKNAVRQIMRARREALTDGERREKSKKICDIILDYTSFNPEDTVMTYTSKPLEVDTSYLIHGLIEQGTPVVVPIIVKKDVSLRLSYLKDPSVLVKSTFDVPEPIGNEIPAKAKDVDTVILPMLGFDLHGNRLGYGAGYYDRFLAKNSHITAIGIAFACQEANMIPHRRKDIKLDFIATEEGLMFC
jgi:5-formyltetrahydrofolate cyclo-ligase